jgi:tripartite ATP-independent transporter DctP family solute receptor
VRNKGEKAVNAQFGRRWLIGLAAIVPAVWAGVVVAESKTIIKLGHLQAPANHQQTAALRFAELVAKNTNGSYEVKVFPAAQLGNGQEMLESVRQDNLEMTMFGTDLTEPVFPAMGALDLPYIWDRETAHKLLRGALGRRLATQFLAATGVRIIAWGDLGEQSILTRTKTVQTRADLAGLKIRVPEVPSTVSAFRAWGANPTVITFSQVYNALDRGVVDGAVMPPDLMLTSRLYEVAKQLSLTHHLFLPYAVMISDKFLRAQPSAAQEAITAAAREAFETYDGQLYVEAAQQALNEMRTKGVTITEPDRAAFRNLVGPVWKEFTDKVPAAAEFVTEIEQAK